MPSHALVLAGSRGPTDPVAASRGLAHKALVPVDGVPMLERVVATLFESEGIEHVILLADEALIDHGFGPRVTAGIERGRITLAEPASSPSESVERVLEGLDDDGFPLLVTTADHPLLTVEMVEHFCSFAPGGADFAVGLAEAATVQRDHPDAIRTFYRFRDGRYSGCNLFLLATSKARRVVAFWRQMERHRKRPWCLIAAVGLPPLLRFAVGRLDLEGALRHLSSKVGAEIGMVAMPFAEAAIDVDKPADLDLAEAVLRARSEGGAIG